MSNIYSAVKPAGLYNAQKSVTPAVGGIVLAIKLGNDYIPATGNMKERFISNVYVQMAVPKEGAKQYATNINTLVNSSPKMKASLKGGDFARRTNQKVQEILSWVGTPKEILQKRKEFHLLRQRDRVADIAEADPGSLASRWQPLSGDITDYEYTQILKYTEDFDMSNFKHTQSREVAENLRKVFLSYAQPIEYTHLITFNVPFLLNEYGCGDKNQKSASAIGYKNGVIPVYSVTDDDWVSSYTFMCAKSFREQHGNLVGEVLDEKAGIEDMIWNVIPTLDFVSFSAMVSPVTPVGKQQIQQILIPVRSSSAVGPGPGRVALQVEAFKKKNPGLLPSANVPKQLAPSVAVEAAPLEARVITATPQVSPSIPKNNVSVGKKKEESNVSNKDQKKSNNSFSSVVDRSEKGDL